MKLGIQLLNTDASINRYSVMKNIKVNQGETLSLVFQLVDLDQNKNRFVPTSNATVLVEIPRFPDAFGSIGNQRIQTDFSVRRAGAMLFPADDRSIWYVPLNATDTANMMSSNVRVTLVDGASTYIATLSMALVVTRSELDPQPSNSNNSN